MYDRRSDAQISIYHAARMEVSDLIPPICKTSFIRPDITQIAAAVFLHPGLEQQGKIELITLSQRP